jgi:hypothetical protein
MGSLRGRLSLRAIEAKRSAYRESIAEKKGN